MNLKHGLTLPVLWYTDKDHELKELGISSNDAPEIKLITFYSIDHLYETTYGEDKKVATFISSGGSDYLCNDSVGVINSAIKDRL